MKTITLKNIPDDVYQRLKTQAKISHRSLNGEIIYWLERSLGVPKRPSAEEVLQKAREFREKVKIYLTEEQINEFKKTGRE